MARYIDADALKLDIDLSKGASVLDMAISVITSVKDAPTTDVVPKSEYDAVVSAVDNSTKEFLKLHDDYQEAKREIDKWMGRCREWHEVAEEKSKLVREIFEEIEEAKEQWEAIYSSDHFGYGGGAYGYLEIDVDQTIYELKKKYTGENEHG